MISGSHISDTMPTATTPGIALAETRNYGSSRELQDLSQAPATPRKVSLSQEEKGNIVSSLVKITNTAISNNALSTDTPYVTSAHIVVKHDKRYATEADMTKVIANLLNWCLEKADSTSYNIVRIAKGEL